MGLRDRLTTERRDIVLAAALTALVELELTLAADMTAGARAVSAAAALAVLALAWRRVRPLAVTALLLGALLAQQLLGGVLTSQVGSPYVAVLLATFSVGGHVRGARLAAGLVATAAGLTLINQLAPDNEYSVVNDLAFFAGFMVGAPALLGRVLAARGRAVDELRGRAAEVERDREAAADAAGERERERLDRELHDALAHRVGEIALQAAGARRVAGDDPERARAALEAIELAARSGLDDIRAVLGVLRHGDEDLALEPQPTLARLEPLVAGLDVAVVVEGERGHVPGGVDVTAYRVVQEALHEGGRATRLHVRYTRDAIELEIDGAAVAGAGLATLRDRVGLYGGWLRTGEGAVRARIPLEAA